LWFAGESIGDRRRLHLPSTTPPGGYQIALGIYYWPTAERLPVFGENLVAVADGRLTLPAIITVQD
jgi:hypothetical protein